ncbi:MAG: DUF2306 domain-containing protein [Myxococcales bacterium]|nr:DUF2306 domain-containing protein [Myxococcales bacterium]
MLALSIIPVLGGLVRLASFTGLAAPQSDHARFAARPWVLGAHIVAGVLFATLGALQFAPALRRAGARVHRALGLVVVPAAVLTGLSGFATMIVFDPAPTQGPVLHTLRALSGLALLAFVARGALAIRAKDTHGHRAWMTRAYAIGIAPGVQAFALAPLVVTGGETELTYTLGMAIGWAISLAVAERSIRAARVEPSATSAVPMKAVVYERYGSPDELRVAEVKKPTPGKGQVLVRVEASSLNAADRRLLRADPFLARLDNGLFRPSKKKILGADFAGTVEAIGEGVSSVTVGQRVFGDASHDAFGGFAEFVCVRESAVAPIPKGLDATRAAALPLAASTALQAVRERAKVTRGQRVLIYGAGGAVGGYLVQVAKAYGAHVTAVCSKRSVDAVRGFGADVVLDVRDPLPSDGRFDAVFGVNGYRPVREYLSILGPEGRYVMIGGDNGQIFGALARSAFNRSIIVLTMDPALLQKDLEELRALVEDGRLIPMVDAVYPLERVADALRAVEAGEVRGKIVITVGATPAR